MSSGKNLIPFLVLSSGMLNAQPSGADLSLLEKYSQYDFFYLLYSEKVNISIEK